MEANKTTKLQRFFRRYSYWVALGCSILLLALVITLSIGKANQKQPETDFTPVNVATIKFAEPLQVSSVVKNYSNTALQYSATLNLWQSHKAIDFAAEEGTEVYAVMDGTIKEVTYNYLMGNIVKLDIGGGIVVVYASLQGDIPVAVGDTVSKGDVIGKVGNTAKSEAKDGPHLHLEVLFNDEKVDPNGYLDLSVK